MDKVQVPVEEGLSGAPKTDNASPVENNERPEWLPEKFKSPEELAKSYAELERKLGGKPTVDEAFDQETAETQQVEDALPENPEGQPYIPGMEADKVQEISDYAWENRELTDDHYAELEKAGYPREVVDQFMQGQFAAREMAESQLYNAGGGKENVEAMFAWAGENLSQEQIDTYNERLDRGGADAIMAIEHLKSRYDASGYADAQTVQAANAPTTETSVFRSTQQVVEAMSDPRYKSDPAYRADVERKLQRSNIF